MRHNAHYVEEIVARSGAAIGRMIPIEQLVPNADQPRKDRGEMRGLIESVREKGVLEPLLVRYLAESEKYMIISGERRYYAARAAGLSEVPCIEKDADEAETLEIALIENLQRKDLSPFEEADGIQALGDRFALTHEDIARKIGKGRSSITEALSLRSIPDPVKALCIEKGVLSKSQLLQVARQPSEARMRDLVRRFALGMVNREQARQERQPEHKARPAVFRFVPPAKEFKLVMKFRRNSVERAEIVEALRRVIEMLESEA
jgi:ParB family transcriptional regulator, chromosome partitioning protein